MDKGFLDLALALDDIRLDLDMDLAMDVRALRDGNSNTANADRLWRRRV